MTNQFKKARDIFLEALNQPLENRSRWLDEQCEGDTELRDFVNDLLDETGRTEDPLEAGISGKSRIEHPTPIVPGYTLLRQVAVGGQGIVYEARQDSTGQSVAVKVLLRGAIASESQRTRFEREVEILAKVTHPHIVSIVDRGETEDGMPYLVTQFVHGWPVDKYAARAIASDTQEVTELLPLFVKIANAIDFAHKRGVIHRDLKPSNILVDPHGEPRILDFGLAKPLLGEFSDARTIDGSFMGSLPWASPEQAHGDPQGIDHRSDVYSLGVILYQMLTGGLFPYPVVGSMRDVLDNILNAKPTPPSELSSRNSVHPSDMAAPKPIPSVNPALEAIVLTALEKSPAKRQQSALELANEIRDYLAGRTSDAPVEIQPKKQSRTLLPLIATILALGAGIWCVTEWTKSQSTSPHVAQSVDPASSEPSADALAESAVPKGQENTPPPPISHPKDLVAPKDSEEQVFQKLSKLLEAKDYQGAAHVYGAWREIHGSESPDIRRCTDLVKGGSDPLYGEIMKQAPDRTKDITPTETIQDAQTLLNSIVLSNLDSISSFPELTSHRFISAHVERAELLTRLRFGSVDALADLLGAHRFARRMCQRYADSEHVQDYHEARSQLAELVGFNLLKAGFPYAASRYFRESALAYVRELRDPEYRSDAFLTDVALLIFSLPDGGGLYAEAQEIVDAIRTPQTTVGKVAAAATQFANGQYELASRSWSELANGEDDYGAHIAYSHLAACKAHLDHPDDARRWLRRAYEVTSSQETLYPHGMAKNLMLRTAERALKHAEADSSQRGGQQLIADIQGLFSQNFFADACNAYLAWRQSEDGFNTGATNELLVELFANEFAGLPSGEGNERVRLARTIVEANSYSGPDLGSTVAKALLKGYECWAESIESMSDDHLVALYLASDSLEQYAFVTGATGAQQLASARGWVRYQLARQARYRGRFDEAADSFQRSAIYFREAKNASAAVNSKHQLAVLDTAVRPQMKDSYREHLSVLQQLHEENPDRSDLLTAIAACRLRLGYHQNAKALLERARELNFEDSLNWLYQAIASRSLGELSESAEWIGRFERSSHQELDDALVRRLWVEATITQPLNN